MLELKDGNKHVAVDIFIIIIILVIFSVINFVLHLLLIDIRSSKYLFT